MRTIPLTQGRHAVVDDEDYERLSEHSWFAMKLNGRFYAARNSPWRGVGGKRPLIMMAREIMGARPGQIVDHRDHDTLNNTRGNLRLCSRAQNNRNATLRRDSRSGYKGVKREGNRWSARIQANGYRHHLGRFTSAKAAARAYDDAARRLHGAFALTNKNLGLL